MSRFKFSHPTKKMYADYGLDHAAGWFVSIYENDAPGGYPTVEYDQRLNPDMERLGEVLQKFIQHEFFTTRQLEQALIQLQDEDLESMEPELRRIAQLVINLKQDYAAPSRLTQ